MWSLDVPETIAPRKNLQSVVPASFWDKTKQNSRGNSLLFQSKSSAHSIETKHLCTKRHSGKIMARYDFHVFDAFFSSFFFVKNSFVVFCKIKKSPLGLKTVLFYSISVLCFCKLCKFRSRTSGVRKREEWAVSYFTILQKNKLDFLPGNRVSSLIRPRSPRHSRLQKSLHENVKRKIQTTTSTNVSRLLEFRTFPGLPTADGPLRFRRA